MRLAINGLGRIGRTVLRVLSHRGFDEAEVVAVNDLADPDNLAYLLEYDSTFGALGCRVSHANGILTKGHHQFPLTARRDADFDTHGAEILLDCSGQHKSFDQAAAWTKAGHERVLVSGPLQGQGQTIAFGVNEAAWNGQRLISMGSCTTNATAVLLAMFDRTCGVRAGHFTTVHCYTGSQPTIDRPGDKWERGRAAALSMVPTSTSATEALGQVLPDLAPHMTGASIRVPTASVSAVDLIFQPSQRVSEDDITHIIKNTAAAGPVIGWTDHPLVSSDLRARSETSIIALPETRINKEGWVRVLAWYDNEWGFACRMLDMAKMMTRSP